MGGFTKQPCDEGVVLGVSARPAYSKRIERWTLIATIIASSMAFIDGTVVNVALPVLQQDLDASVTDVQWIVEAFTLFLSSLMLVGGALGDRYGRRRVFAFGITVFTLASLVCGFAQNPLQLILARGVQGIGGALLVPGSLAIISATFSSEQKGRAIGTWSAFSAITTAIGPILGGWMVEQFSWRYVFFINLLPAAFVLVILFRYLPESRADDFGEKLDWPGALLGTAGFGGIIVGLLESANRGLLDPLVLSSVAIGTIALLLFLIVQARSRNPMMPLSLFKSINFSGANLLTFLLYFSLGGAFFFLPFNLIQVQGYSATAAGAAILPFVIFISLLSRWAGGLINRFGAQLPLIIGPAIAAIGYALFSIPGIGGDYWTTFFPAVAVIGIGMGISIAPLTTVVMDSVEEGRSGIASGVNNAVSRVAGLLAIPILGIILIFSFNENLNATISSLGLSTREMTVIEEQRINLAAADLSSLKDSKRAEVKSVIDKSYVIGFRTISWAAAAMAVAAAISSLIMIQGKNEE